jgi:hypothetical protein
MRPALLLVLVGCIGGSHTPLATGDDGDPVTVSRDCRGAPDDEIHLEALAVDGERLRVTAVYGGGCEEHRFAACWDGTVLDSAPPQLRLHMRHDANDDGCDALVTREVVIDLSSLAFPFQSAALATPDGTIQLLGR